MDEETETKWLTDAEVICSELHWRSQGWNQVARLQTVSS